ncbi:6'''-hydroxyparomomycin C oxidase [Sporomusa ovata DSM 2662]|uniref:Glucose-methanol-choline (GMC) oxidoreductase:NAD binding site n=1 Tax=Sporomusa ovata TaxID=2378 RepID=A0A0U1KZ72_9FIRM|nr:GMC family oxidoreductase [Sporomusa ovata]EQB28818.1 glucose-methanol-choline oxidoreductase [Sporomusa ovata DSM 2662]CQR72243.1 Glucose-methanol-choline (GMC) oxidoreductase:NAD binding site [Sporomusa ovata]
MTYDADVIIIGAGGGGPVAAKELGEKGLKVLLLEAGPWYGHKQWPNPNKEQGAVCDTDPENLSNELLAKHFTNREDDINNYVTGRFRWGQADRKKTPWLRHVPHGGFIWQSAGVGGTTLLYFGNSPRAYPSAVEDAWPISYRELIPYYEKVEATLPVTIAPMTAKEELFFYGAKKAGWPLLKTRNVTSPGYRPQLNAILPIDPNINDPTFTFDGKNLGCTLCGHCINGCHIGPTIKKTAKRSTLVSYIPLALDTGMVAVRPNTFVTKILTEAGEKGLKAVGVRCRNTWTGETGEFKAKTVILAAGAIETPRLWLNSKLPDNPWVGKGLTTHWFDCVSGVFDEQVLLNILGTLDVKSYVGQNSAVRFDYPGVGVIQGLGLSPGLFSSLQFTLSKEYNFLRRPKTEEPWDIKGKIVGQELIELMLDYPRMLSLLIFTDDEVNQKNEITLTSLLKDEHGSIPTINHRPSNKDKQKKDTLATIAADILKNAGAKKIIRSDCAPYLFVHIQSTMRMGYVVDRNCEALQVKRLFITDNSVLYNGLGGPNPTLTTQALSTRTAEKIAEIYFNGT